MLNTGSMLHYFIDPGHGWLRVPVDYLKKIGIADKITKDSYVSDSHAYLEEDIDMGLFLRAIGAYGKYDNYKWHEHVITIEDDKLSVIRDFARYNASKFRQ